MKIEKPRGTYDLLPDETRKWQALEDDLRRIAELYGFGEIRFPMFEHTELFMRGMGETGDVVQKEMYTFQDKDGRSLTLRPEGTASVVRAFIEHGLHMSALPFKCFYIAPNFRYEKPQKGRYRQHVQLGIECFGAAEPQADVEVISFAHTVLRGLDAELHINSIGCKECRPVYQQNLKTWLSAQSEKLCENCRTRLDRNPMRVLDCKVETCAAIAEKAPKINENLCPGCADFAARLDVLLTASGIPFVRDPRIVRGFDYYTGTVFEFISHQIGAQGTICGGGRYDGLVEELGGQPTPALGFGMGLERLLLAQEAMAKKEQEKTYRGIYLAPMGTVEECVRLCRELRELGVRAETDLCARSLKAQMKYADKIGVKCAAVIGDDELEKSKMTLKDMQTGETAPCALNAGAIVKHMNLLVEVEYT
ncbi:MAG: histidine--tRNA ligase [Oscillospiraceae bacterium]|nr:histidine--tRNA ligase [Oscillospiraceae bacterium]